jgi:hypothetical protein
MHSFVTRKGNKCKQKIYLGIIAKTKHARESLNDSNDDVEFTFHQRKKMIIMIGKNFINEALASLK